MHVKGKTFSDMCGICKQSRVLMIGNYKASNHYLATILNEILEFHLINKLLLLLLLLLIYKALPSPKCPSQACHRKAKSQCIRDHLYGISLPFLQHLGGSVLYFIGWGNLSERRLVGFWYSLKFVYPSHQIDSSRFRFRACTLFSTYDPSVYRPFQLRSMNRGSSSKSQWQEVTLLSNLQ